MLDGSSDIGISVAWLRRSAKLKYKLKIKVYWSDSLRRR